MNQIFLLSGPIHTGKTTKLTEWIKNKKDVDGILQPVIDGQRHITHISSGEIQSLEISPSSDEKNIVRVGNYKFKDNVFNWACSKLLLAYKMNPEWLIIDEVGKLKLDGKGLEPAISKILFDPNDNSNINLIFVVRDYLVPNFLIKYCLDQNIVQPVEV